MTPEISQQIADLFGQIPLSRLPVGDLSPITGNYVVYTQGDSNVYRIASSDLYTYICRNVFRFVFDGMNSSATDEKSCILLNPQKYVQQGDTPITYARRLLSLVNKPNEMWIGEPAPAESASRKTNISQEWFKHFQYYYFDNLNNRQRTMLLKHGEVHEVFDIVIWMDRSGSMANEIQDIKNNLNMLCDLILSHNPENRVAIVQYGDRLDMYPNPADDPDGTAGRLPVDSLERRPWSYFYNRELIASRFGGLTNDRAVIEQQINALSMTEGVSADESLWSIWKVARMEPPPGYDSNIIPEQYKDKTDPYKSVSHPAPEWKRMNWRENTKKIIIAITDEPMDAYIAVSKQYAIPFKPNKTPTFEDNAYSSDYSSDLENPLHSQWWNAPAKYTEPSNLDTDTVDSPGDLDSANWYHAEVYLWEHDTGYQYEQGFPLGGDAQINAIMQTRQKYYKVTCPNCHYNEWLEFFQPDREHHPEILKCPNCEHTNIPFEEPRKTGEHPWSYTSPYWYKTPEERFDIWAKPFNDNNIKVYFINTMQPTDELYSLKPEVKHQRWITGCEAYVHAVKNDLLSRVTAGGKCMTVEPTKVAYALADIFRTEAANPWSNCMWKSHLESKTVQQLPCFITKEGHLKMLNVAPTAVVRNPSGTVNDPENFIWSEFQKRNYTKIVTGGWDANNSDDKAWAAVKTVTVKPSPEVNDDIVDGRGEVVARNIGDIDQTLKVIGEFLDDVFLSIKPMEHAGQVVFTASTETNPFGFGWHNVISGDDQNESFVWSGDTSLTGENGNLVPGIPQHHHNTTLVNNEAIPIGNVSIIGRPEGETVGGIAKVDTAERLPTASYGKREDTVHKIAGTGAALDGEGAYNGTVEYDAYEISATQQRHNNMPLYYKVRAFVHD